MQITFKLYASLTDHLPPEARRSNQVLIDVPQGATLAQIIEPYALPMRLVHLVLINGVYVPPEERETRTLKPGDTLAIWPPIAGG